MSHSDRLQRLRDAVREGELAAAVLSHSRDIYYYTGTSQPAFLVVQPVRVTLFVRRGLEFAREETCLPAESVEPEASFRRICERVFPDPGGGERVGTELDVVTALQADKMRQALGDRILVDVSPIVLAHRMVKDESEIRHIRRACAAVEAGHRAVMADLRPGMTELELAAHIENAQRLAGHEGAFFMRVGDFAMSRGPVASGPNLRRTSGTVATITGVGLSPAMRGGPSDRVIQKGDLVVVDIPACVYGYHADQSRTYAVGSAPTRARELFGRLRAVADHLIESLRPGLTTGDGFDLAVARAEELEIGEIFRRFEAQPQAGFVAHGVGLELNEPPVLVEGGRTVLQEGMVLAIEMHLMEPGGLTLKLEDTIHLAREGAEILTLSPRELIVVES